MQILVLHEWALFKTKVKKKKKKDKGFKITVFQIP